MRPSPDLPLRLLPPPPLGIPRRPGRRHGERRALRPPGATIEVPVYARDVSATPLGVDQPAGSRIQSLSYKVTFTPASSVASKLFARAGITAGLTPIFQATPTTATTASYLGTFDEATDSHPLHP